MNKKVPLAVGAVSVFFVGMALVACPSTDPAPPSPLLTVDAAAGPDTSKTPDGAILDGGGGSDTAPPVDAAPCTLAVQVSDPKCSSCLQASCCPEANACLGNPDCVALVKCLAACVPDAQGQMIDGSIEQGPCVNGCNAAHVKSRNAALHYGSCVSMSCASACPF